MLDFSTEDAARSFEFAVNGEVHSVPTVDSLPVDIVIDLSRRYRDAGAAGGEVLAEFVRALFEKHAPGVCELLTAAQYAQLCAAYMDTLGGLDAGES